MICYRHALGNLDVVSSSLLSAPHPLFRNCHRLSKAHYLVRTQKGVEREGGRERLSSRNDDARKTSLVSFQLSATRKQYPLRTCALIRNDTAATDIGCYRLKASRKLPLYGTCQSLFPDFISITRNGLRKTCATPPTTDRSCSRVSFGSFPA